MYRLLFELAIDGRGSINARRVESTQLLSGINPLTMERRDWHWTLALAQQAQGQLHPY